MNLSAFKPRLRFSLRTILVVMTLFALFFWYQWNWIQQRRAALKSGEVEGWTDPFSDDITPSVDAPAFLGLFGENGYSGIWINDVSPKRLREASELFPEAEIVYKDKGTESDPFRPFGDEP